MKINEVFGISFRKFVLNICLTRKVPVFPHIETSQLICTTNQLTGFYMRETLALNGLNKTRKSLNGDL